MINQELTEVKNLLPTAQNILVALPQTFSIDQLAAGLSLYLAFKQAGKEVSITTAGIVTVGHTNLYGVGSISNDLPQGSGDLVIVLGGVASTDGKIPAVEKLDYYATGSDWNLSFKTRPGFKFEPTFITPKRAGSGFDLIFTIGALNLESLGSIYLNHKDIFPGQFLVNINNQSSNSQFGKINLSYSAASVSELVTQVITNLGLPIDADIASNILSGIYSATNNLTSGALTAETFESIAQALRAGGKKPGEPNTVSSVPASAPIESGSIPFIQPEPKPSAPASGPTFDLSKIFGAPVFPAPASDTKEAIPQEQPSDEEVPAGEGAITPGDDWLTPKIYKGSGVG